MFAFPLRTSALAVAAAIGLSACTTGYGYNGLSVGIGNGYYDPYYSGYGYGYGSHYRSRYGFDPYWGWYDGFYYPGSGFYVYDRYRRPFRWTDRHRRYWEQRRERTLASGFRQIATNWSDFERNRTTSSLTRDQIEHSDDSSARVDRRGDRPSRIERREARSERGAARLERRSARSERQSARAERRSERGVERVSRSSSRNRSDNRER